MVAYLFHPREGVLPACRVTSGLTITHLAFCSRSSSSCFSPLRAAWLVPHCAHHHPLHLKDNGGAARRAGGLRLRASGEHTIHPCPERSILCARRAST